MSEPETVPASGRVRPGPALRESLDKLGPVTAEAIDPLLRRAARSDREEGKHYPRHGDFQMDLTDIRTRDGLFTGIASCYTNSQGDLKISGISGWTENKRAAALPVTQAVDARNAARPPVSRGGPQPRGGGRTQGGLG